MEITFADSFFKSLEKLKRRHTWWYKTYETIRYNIPNFFRNIWYFRKALYKHRGWDSHYSLLMFRRSLEDLYDKMSRYSNECDDSLIPKLHKIKKALDYLDSIINDNYISISESIHGEVRGGLLNETEEEAEHNRKVFNYATELELKYWDELWDIIKGNDDRGSDMRGWWY